MAATGDSTDDFGVSMSAKWFHAIPHIDIEFKFVNATFDPSSNAYLEALGIIIAIPGFWLILTLLAFLIFFLCRCCDTGFKKKKKLTPLKWALCIFAIFCCGALSVGLFGNVQAHKGVDNVQKATSNLHDILDALINKTFVIDDSLHGSISHALDQLEEVFQKPLSNQSVQNFLVHAVKDMKENVSLGQRNTAQIKDQIWQLSLPNLPYTIYLVEFIRWPATFAVLCLLILICLILFWGVVRHSRCLLILFSVLGLLSVVICWVLVSMYIGICVAGADFCLDPKPFIKEQCPADLDEAVLNYYLKCGTTPDPFENAKLEDSKAVKSVEATLKSVSAVTDVYLPQKDVRDLVDSLSTSVKETEQTLGQVEDLLNCQKIHKEYIQVMDGICTDGLEGTAFMLMSAVGAGLFFTILIWLSSHTWIHIRKKRQTEHVDEEDPFLPASAVGSNPRRNRETNGRSNSREEQTFLQGRFTPPPAYDQLSGGPSRYPSYKS